MPSTSFVTILSFAPSRAAIVIATVLSESCANSSSMPLAIHHMISSCASLLITLFAVSSDAMTTRPVNLLLTSAVIVIAPYTLSRSDCKPLISPTASCSFAVTGESGSTARIPMSSISPFIWPANIDNTLFLKKAS